MATIQGVYVALFGRPADPRGLAFFNAATSNGANLSAIGDLAATKEYSDRFAGLSNNAIVNSIYQSLFNRDAEPGGLAFFVDALNRGTLTINTIAIAILDGAQGNDRTIVDNKIASAQLFTAALDTAVEIGAYAGNAAAALGRSFLADVTTAPKSAAQADAAVALVVSATASGKSDITLTAGADTVGTAVANAAFKATDFNDTITTTGANWDPSADSIDAGFGTDTFTIVAAATASVQADRLKNVEIINISVDGNVAASLSVANARELSQIWNSASTKGLSVDGIALAVTVGLKGAIGDVTSFAYANSSGSSDAATLSVNAATTSAGKAVTINAIETLTIANTGTSALAGGISGNAFKSVVISGSGSLTSDLTTTANNLTIEAISTAGFTGSITTDLTNLNAIRTYAGGAGVDRLIIDGEHVNDVTLDLGGANDVLRFTATGAPDTAAVTVLLGAGADLVAIDSSIGNVRSAGTNADLLKTLITIADFSKAEDAITLDVLSPTADRVTLLLADIVAIESSVDLLAATRVAATKTAVGKVLTFSYKGDAYIYQNSGTSALDAGDIFVKLTGVSVSDLTQANFELT